MFFANGEEFNNLASMIPILHISTRMINSISFSGKNCNLKQFPNNCFEHGPFG